MMPVLSGYVWPHTLTSQHRRLATAEYLSYRGQDGISTKIESQKELTMFIGRFLLDFLINLFFAMLYWSLHVNYSQYVYFVWSYIIFRKSSESKERKNCQIRRE